MAGEFSNCGECGHALDFKKPANVEPWIKDPIESAHCGNCGQNYERKPGADFAYQGPSGGEYRCTKDGGLVSVVDVRHSVLGSSTGVTIEQVKYCLRHEQRPDSDGAPIRSSDISDRL